MRTSLAFAAAGFLLLTAPALAAARGDNAAFAPVLTAVSMPVLPATAGAFSRTHGSINSSNTVSANSGGNSGSNVTTGDQSSSVTVVNIGPADTNSSTVISSPASGSASAPQCSGRLCLRTR